ncbi:MAG: hypothetical protein ACOC53_05270 [Candidatus Saliniplasma sp.]
MIKILYRELHYQMAKENPMMNGEKEFNKQVRKAMDMKRNVLQQSLIFLLFGAMTAGSIFVAEDEAMVVGVLTSLALIPFVLSLYQTTIQASFLTSLGIFEPLKPLPVDLGGKYMSGVISVDLVPGFVLVLPAAVALILRAPLSGILTMFWMMVGVLAGHVIGLGIYALFGQKVMNYKGSLSFLKNVLKVIGLLLFMGLFFGVMYFQDFFAANIGTFTDYPFVFPVSLASVFDPINSLILLAVHLAILVPLYFLSLKKVWSGILEPALTSSGKVEKDYKISLKKPIISLILKDLKVIGRKTSMIAGLLFPLYIALPQMLLRVSDSRISMGEMTYLVFLVGIVTVAGADAILKVEGKSMSFLRTLPLSKAEFAVSKALSMSIVPLIVGIGMVGLGVYFTVEVIYLLPLVLILPITAAVVTMSYLFRYEGDMIGVPEFDFKKMILLFLIVGMVFGIVAVPILFMESLLRYIVSPLLAVLITFILYLRLNR